MKKWTGILAVILMMSCQQDKIAYVDNVKLMEGYQKRKDVEAAYQLKSEDFNKRRDSISQTFQLEAQEVQGPVVELSTEWLILGHVDEVLLFVPDLHRPDRPFRVVLASPALARQELLQLEAQGAGDTPLFEGRELETTVAELLADEDLIAYNDGAQARIDEVRDQLAAEMELDDEDFIELPVLYEPRFYDGLDLGRAFSPGMQNVIVAGSTLFVPDPEGPEHLGKDVWQHAATTNLAPLGLAVEYVDVFESYHLLGGEAHCGANVERAPYVAQWWTP